MDENANVLNDIVAQSIAAFESGEDRSRFGYRSCLTIKAYDLGIPYPSRGDPDVIRAYAERLIENAFLSTDSYLASAFDVDGEWPEAIKVGFLIVVKPSPKVGGFVMKFAFAIRRHQTAGAMAC